MITYELAKQLKDAGWPQDHWSPARFLYPDERPSAPMMFWEKAQKDKLAYAPSLSELIAACPKIVEYGWTGARFVLKWDEDGKVWSAALEWHEIHEGGKGEGPTPEEATARLWLKLQESET